jgi:uncharacterized protein with NAD-binding domain and iron-sulfur cluster
LNGKEIRARGTVGVLGGGVAGLTAAHELADHGFRVTVYEQYPVLGGKARSHDVPSTAQGGRRPLPGEHGFHFVGGMYRNLSDTLSRIPFGANPNGVLDNLVPTREWRFARAGGPDDLVLTLPRAHPLWQVDLVRQALAAGVSYAGEAPPRELVLLVRRIVTYLTSSSARRFGQWELMSWSDFLKADSCSEEYRLHFARLSESFQAVKPHDASSRTMGSIVEAFLYAAMQRAGSGEWERVLDGPANERWIEPWASALMERGVRFQLNSTVIGLECRDKRITSVQVQGPDGIASATADWFVCALPPERARQLWNPGIIGADPQLAQMAKLKTEWMNGIQFFLRQRTDIAGGSVGYVDSPWSLSSISQAQFWQGRDLSRDYGDGSVCECLSAIVSDWSRPGVLFDRPARSLAPGQVAREVWEQMKGHLNKRGETVLEDKHLVCWQLDPAISYTAPAPDGNGSEAANAEPLFVNTAGSWSSRPRTASGIRNLLLAGDYVRTDFDVASMESANESGRRAARAVLQADSGDGELVRILPPYRPRWLDRVKRYDGRRYQRGQAHLLDSDTDQAPGAPTATQALK